jgi:hypothetical protein
MAQFAFRGAVSSSASSAFNNALPRRLTLWVVSLEVVEFLRLFLLAFYQIFVIVSAAFSHIPQKTKMLEFYKSSRKGVHCSMRYHHDSQH